MTQNVRPSARARPPRPGQVRRAPRVHVLIADTVRRGGRYATPSAPTSRCTAAWSRSWRPWACASWSRTSCSRAAPCEAASTWCWTPCSALASRATRGRRLMPCCRRAISTRSPRAELSPPSCGRLDDSADAMLTPAVRATHGRRAPGRCRLRPRHKLLAAAGAPRLLLPAPAAGTPSGLAY